MRMTDLLGRVADGVSGAFVDNWPFLLMSVLAAALVTTYVGTERLRGFLAGHTGAAVLAAVALATLTPFCSCGTMAIVLGGMAASSPWAPIVAFLVASPLTSPSELVLSAGFFGWPFAITFFVGTIVLGLAAGAVTHLVEGKGLLRDQARMVPAEKGSGAAALAPAAVGAGPGTPHRSDLGTRLRRLRPGEFGRQLLVVGRRLMLYFVVFAAIGYAIIEVVPQTQVERFLGGDGIGAVPLAAVLGIPAYVSTEASLPLVAGLTDGGMGLGPAMAFLVTGAGTSLGAIGGLLAIARRRVVGLVIGFLGAGSLAMGWIAGAIL